MDALLAAADMGLGKTAATLTGTRRFLRANPTWRALIVGPLGVVTGTWPDERDEWEHLQDITYTIVTGTVAQRKAALEVDADYTMINRENLRWLWETVGGRKGWRWQILIYDEASRLKGFTRRTKGTERIKPRLTEFGTLVQARPKIKKVIQSSGTPAPNGVLDLGGPFCILDGGERLGRNKTQFHRQFADKNLFCHEIKPKPDAEERIIDLTKDLMIGLRAEDYIDRPPQLFNPRYVKLPSNLMRQYKEFEKTLYAQEYDVEACVKGCPNE